MPSRAVPLLGAVGVGALFAAGLFVHGAIGGVLLLVTDAILLTLSMRYWDTVRPQGRPLRLIVIAGILVLAAVKLAGKA